MWIKIKLLLIRIEECMPKRTIYRRIEIEVSQHMELAVPITMLRYRWICLKHSREDKDNDTHFIMLRNGLGRVCLREAQQKALLKRTVRVCDIITNKVTRLSHLLIIWRDYLGCHKTNGQADLARLCPGSIPYKPPPGAGWSSLGQIFVDSFLRVLTMLS